MNEISTLKLVKELKVDIKSNQREKGTEMPSGKQMREILRELALAIFKQ